MPAREETEIVTLRLPVSIIKALDRAVELGLAKNRSELIREALVEYLKTLSFAISIRVQAKKNAKNIVGEYALIGKAIAEAMSRGVGSSYVKMSERVGAILQDHSLEEVEEYGKFLETITKE